MVSIISSRLVSLILLIGFFSQLVVPQERTKSAPANEMALLSEAVSLLQAGKPDQAEPLLRRVIAIAPSGPLFEKTASNLQEAAARGGQVIVFSDAAGASKLKSIAVDTVILPDVHDFVAPILYAIPVQLLAYHVAVLKGTDVDQPRNLAKSVTVE